MPRQAWLLGSVIAALVLAASIAASSAETRPSGGGPRLYVGGVAGITDLLDPAHSQRFRAAGGGLYLHNTGWMRLDWQQQEQILQAFRGAPVAIEFAFLSGPLWGEFFQRDYLAHGISPVFIAVNAFAKNHHPTLEEWSAYTTALRQRGVPASTQLLPTFEYQNFGPNIATLPQHAVSVSPPFQALIAAAGGLVLDTPPGYFLAREPAYREWVVDAIHWAKRHDFTTIVIVSPHFSGSRWGEDTAGFMRYLKDRGAMPGTFVCENYEGSPSPTYPNKVGADDLPSSVLGVCDMLREKFQSSVR